MNKLIIALLMIMMITPAYAGVSKRGADLMDHYFSNGVATEYRLGSAIFEGSLQVAKGVWDYAKKGGSCGKIDLNVDIPDNALIKRVYYIVETKPTMVGRPTISLGASTYKQKTELVTEKDAKDLHTNELLNGNPQNTLATMIQYGASTTKAGWDLEMTVRNSAGKELSTLEFFTAGKIVFFVEYVITE